MHVRGVMAAWTKPLVWFEEVDISAFHSCIVVDFWLSLSDWHLLLAACVFVCHCETVGASSEKTLNFLLNLERVEIKSQRF
jgi:hypothetical protein